MIRHLSKTNHLGFSTNDTLDLHDFPTLSFSAAHVTELVHVSPITVLFCPFSCSAAACEIVWPLVRSFGHLLDHLAACEIVWPLVRLFGHLLDHLAACVVGLLLSCRPLACSLPACLPVGRLLVHHSTLLSVGALCFLCRFFPVLIASVEPV